MSKHFGRANSVLVSRLLALFVSFVVFTVTTVALGATTGVVSDPGSDDLTDVPFDTHSFNTKYTTSGKSMWGAGDAFQIDETFLLGLSWGDKNFTPKIDLGKNVFQGFLAGQLHDGKIGLESKLKINSGTWDVSYPLVASFQMSPIVKAGDKVTMSTAFSPSSTDRPSLKTSGPEARYTLDYVTDFEVTYGIGFDTGLSNTWTTSSQDDGDGKFDQDDWDDGSLFNRHRDDKTLINIKKRETLVDVGSGASGTTVPLGDWGKLELQIPDALKTSSTRFESDGSLSAAGTSPAWADLDANLMQLAANVPPLAPLKALSGDLSLAGFELEYDLFSASLDAKVKLKQEFGFNVTNVGVRLREVNSGDVYEEDLGPLDSLLEHDFSISVPLDTETLDWRATVELEGEFTNRSSILVEGSLYYDIVELEAEFNALGIHKELFDFGPLLHDSFPWDREIIFFDNTIPFSGFEAAVFEFHSSDVQQRSSSLSASPSRAVPEPTIASLLIIASISLVLKRRDSRQMLTASSRLTAAA
jgi:hypothetical protein